MDLSPKEIVKELDKYIGDIVTIKSFDSDLYNEAANVKENEWSWDIRAFEKIYNITSLKELQFADVITLRNSERYVYGDGYILGEDNTYDADCDNIKEGCYNDDLTRNSKDFYYSAIAFGNFNNLLAEFDASKLYEILPNFHNTKVRYQNFLTALEKDEFNRAKDCQKEIEFIKARESYYGKIVDMLASGEMPLKVTHNDTKLNNVLLDDKTSEPVCVIDLDTIMPGSICYDFGDSIRSGCNSSVEDEQDISKVYFRLDLFEMYAKGFLEALGSRIEPIERKNLAFGAILMTIECGMRFLTDYLSGDTYFRTSRQGQNLDRTRTQLKLVADMENVFEQMNAIVEKY